MATSSGAITFCHSALPSTAFPTAPTGWRGGGSPTEGLPLFNHGYLHWRSWRPSARLVAETDDRYRRHGSRATPRCRASFVFRGSDKQALA